MNERVLWPTHSQKGKLCRQSAPDLRFSTCVAFEWLRILILSITRCSQIKTLQVHLSPRWKGSLKLKGITSMRSVLVLLPSYRESPRPASQLSSFHMVSSLWGQFCLQCSCSPHTLTVMFSSDGWAPESNGYHRTMGIEQRRGEERRVCLYSAHKKDIERRPLSLIKS